MKKTLKRTWFLVKEIPHQSYFWPLIGLVITSLALDFHSTCFCVINLGIDGEQSRFVVFLFRGFASLGLTVGLSIFLAMLVSKIILLLAALVALVSIVMAGRGRRTSLNIALVAISLLFLGQAVVGCLNYYRYFLL
jgi:hypothetical protein